MKKPPTCHWTGEIWFTPEHVLECAAPTCKGCRPCPEDHCALRGSCPHHVDHAAGLISCPRCIQRTRYDLNKIELLYATSMREEAEENGVDSEALNMIGPAADSEQFRLRQGWNKQLLEADDWRRGWCEYPRIEIDPFDEHHPYTVLGHWDMALRETYGPQTDLFITVTSAADFLRKLLDGPFPHEQEFEDFSREIAHCLRHLEEIAHDSRRPEQGRPCPRCSEAGIEKPERLVKLYAAHQGSKPGERCAETVKAEEKRGRCAWPRNDHEAECDVCSGALDTWHCPANGEHWWSEADYLLRVARDLVSQADWLTATDMAERTGVNPGTVRAWASKGQVSKKTLDGRVVYRVRDVLSNATRLRAGSVV